MRIYDNRQALISLHIPKCGGTSIRSVLRTWFGSRYLDHYYHEPRRKMPIKYPLGAGICIHGHFDNMRGYGIASYYPEAKQFYTVFRDPFELMVSNYFYMKQHFPSSWPYSNLANYLSTSVTYVQRHMPWKLNKENFVEIFEENFVAVGIVEQLQVSVDILAHILSRPRIIVGHLNISLRDEFVGAHLKERFIESHPLEYLIYDWAVAKVHNSSNSH